MNKDLKIYVKATPSNYKKNRIIAWKVIYDDLLSEEGGYFPGDEESFDLNWCAELEISFRAIKDHLKSLGYKLKKSKKRKITQKKEQNNEKNQK